MGRQNARCVSPTSGRTTWRCHVTDKQDGGAHAREGKSERGGSPGRVRPLSPLEGTTAKQKGVGTGAARYVLGNCFGKCFRYAWYDQTLNVKRFLAIKQLSMHV